MARIARNLIGSFRQAKKVASTRCGTSSAATVRRVSNRLQASAVKKAKSNTGGNIMNTYLEKTVIC